MDWYYVSGSKKVGPVTEGEIEHLADVGTITGETLVWNETSGKWLPYGELRGTSINSASGSEAVEKKIPEAAETPGSAGRGIDDNPRCSQCGRPFPAEEMISYGDALICASCKPLFFQKLKEDGGVHGVMQYAGFWIRFAAKFIDGIIVGIANMVFSTAGSFMFGPMPAPGPGNAWMARAFAMFGVIYLLQLSFHAAYSTFFVGRYAATPGKMACNLKIVTADGGGVSYARALGRHFAEWISAIILGIGYIMAAFDDEKRALHDRVCNTRVIRK